MQTLEVAGEHGCSENSRDELQSGQKGVCKGTVRAPGEAAFPERYGLTGRGDVNTRFGMVQALDQGGHLAAGTLAKFCGAAECIKRD